MTKNIQLGNFTASISFRLNEDTLKKDLLCDDKGDFLVGSSDFIMADERRSFEQEFSDSFKIGLYEDLFDPLYGSNISNFHNADFTSENKLLLKKEIIELLNKNEKIDSSSLTVEINKG